MHITFEALMCGSFVYGGFEDVSLMLSQQASQVCICHMTWTPDSTS